MSENLAPILNEASLAQFLGTCPAFSNFTDVSTELLAGDGSGRRFYRLVFKGSKIKTAVLLSTPPGIGPKLSGDTSYSQEEAFVELCKFYPQVGIPTPTYYGYSADEHWVVMEDVGNIALYRFVGGHLEEAEDKIVELLGGNAVDKLFKKAIDLTVKLQNIEVQKNVIVWKRFLAFDNYRAEISEFSDFYAAPLGLKASAAEELNQVYDAICETIMSFPKALSLFDYNAHNLFVGADGELRVLDFQDSCLVTPARDIVSLINDRGMDELLGQSRHASLLKYFIEKLNSGRGFQFIYDLTLLHWDLRVSGRFVKLNQKFNTDKYQQWIPSTLRRLGRTLQRAEKSLHGLDTLLEIAHQLSPEVREGFSDPWEFPGTAAGKK